jgi:hypothetical protein
MDWWWPAKSRQRSGTGSVPLRCPWPARCRALIRRPSAPTWATTAGISWLIFASQASRLLSRRTSRPAVVQRSMAARPGIRATARRSTPGSGLSRCLAGSNRPQASGSSEPEDDRGWERIYGRLSLKLVWPRSPPPALGAPVLESVLRWRPSRPASVPLQIGCGSSADMAASDTFKLLISQPVPPNLSHPTCAAQGIVR